nr:RtcB family protein [Frisingicoccus sp.]
MKYIYGKYTNAIIYTDVVEQEALDQVQMICDQAFTAGSQIRLMPDIHAGTGCTIGTTMTIGDKIVPNLVGGDIGCGMLAVCIGHQEIPLEQLDQLIYQSIPAGRAIRTIPHPVNDEIDLQDLRCVSAVRLDRAQLSLGSLGGGNHFIEADIDENGNRYLVVHTGSRYLGQAVAKFYQAAGYEQMQMEGVRTSQNVIAELKAQGREREIETALADFKIQKNEINVPSYLAYVSGQLFEDYIHDMKIVQRYSCLNRKAIMDTILNGLHLYETERFETIHNYIDTDSMILRKGAVSAKKGERLLIPINMRDGSLVCTGKGNPEWNYSAPHGAGRLYSRKAAKEKFELEEFAEQMEGIYTTSVCTATIDEAPMCYKNMNDIVDNIGPTAEINAVIRPIYNFKAGN